MTLKDGWMDRGRDHDDGWIGVDRMPRIGIL